MGRTAGEPGPFTALCPYQARSTLGCADGVSKQGTPSTHAQNHLGFISSSSS